MSQLHLFKEKERSKEKQASIKKGNHAEKPCVRKGG